MNINWVAPTIDIFNLDYPPIINIFRQPSEPYSLDSSHALTLINLGCMPFPLQSITHANI